LLAHSSPNLDVLPQDCASLPVVSFDEVAEAVTERIPVLAVVMGEPESLSQDDMRVMAGRHSAAGEHDPLVCPLFEESRRLSGSHLVDAIEGAGAKPPQLTTDPRA
jgi:hypothetical protein